MLKKVKSTKCDKPISLTFVNKSGRKLDCYWINYKGEKVLYRSL